MLTVAGIACYYRSSSNGLRLQKMALWISPNNATVLFCLVQWRCSAASLEASGDLQGAGFFWREHTAIFSDI